MASAKKKTTVKRKKAVAKKASAVSKKTVKSKKTPLKKSAVAPKKANIASTAVKVKQLKKSPVREKKILDVKKKLLTQRDTLLKEAEVALSALPGEINFPDMGDQATAETDRDFMLKLRGRERMLLKKIDEAIERIDSATFGICERCSGEIGIKRLEARPVTTLCIECKTLQEEEERIAEGG